MKRLLYLCIFWTGLSSMAVYIVLLSSVQQSRKSSFVDQINYNNPEDFQGFDNVSGSPDGRYIVPNIVHFVRFGQPEFSFVDAICVLAALKNQRPDKIYFHTDVPNFYGKYWKVILSTPGVGGVIELKYIQVPKRIYGQRLSVKWRKYHAGDIARLLVLMEFGGIFLDNDSYIVRNLNEFRKFELAIGWVPGFNFSNQAIVAHKNARFLREWLLSYKGRYDERDWYYNTGGRPTVDVLSKKPEMVHRVSRRFAEYNFIPHMLYLHKDGAWLDHYVIHLFVNHMHSFLDQNLSSTATYPVVFNEDNIRLYDVNFRDMVYDVYQFNQADQIKSVITGKEFLDRTPAQHNIE